MVHLPLSLIGFFLLTTVLALLGFGRAVRGSKIAIVASILWMCIQSTVALFGFYLATKTLPPRLVLAIAPPLLAIAALFLTRRGRQFIDSVELKWCVLLHSIRILVELNLYWLFLYKQLPVQMTFEGGNLDILVGLSAPVIWWAYNAGHVKRKGLLIWNTICLLSVLNAFGRAMLSAPFRFQQFAFDQPTVAILHFPFILLATFIVPAVVFCHLAVFRKLSVLTVRES